MVTSRVLPVIAIVAFAALPLMAQDKARYEDSSDGLKRQMTETYEAAKKGDKAKFAKYVKALKLPKPESWFTDVFGSEKGNKAATEHEKEVARFEPEVEKLFTKLVRQDQSEVHIRRFTKSPDREAVGIQNDAMAAMIKPTPLYSVRFIKPGEKGGHHVFSFVYVDGGFRLVGKMSALGSEKAK